MSMFCYSISSSLLQCICKDFFSLASTRLEREEKIKQRAQPVIKQRQTCKEVLNHSRASAAQRSEAVLCKVHFVYDVHVLLFNLQVTSAMHSQRFLLIGLHYISKKGKIKEEG